MGRCAENWVGRSRFNKLILAPTLQLVDRARKMPDYELVRVLERADINDYLQLFEKAYGYNDKLTANYLQWLYVANPHGRAVGFDAFCDGELAAHYVTVPRAYRIGSTRLPGLLSVNTATHPDHQRRGLFTRLAAATYELATNEGYQYIVGVANAQSVHGFLSKLAFEHLGQIGLAVWREPPPVPFGYAHLDKDKDWLRWRLANPSAKYFLTKSGKDEVIINIRKGSAVFSIGRISHDCISEESGLEWRRYRGPAILTPVYPREGIGPLLPARFMPSPWHVILRRLGASADGLVKIHFDGLSMDTF